MLKLFGQFLDFEIRSFPLAFPQCLEDLDALRQSGAHFFESLDLRLLRASGGLECFDPPLETCFLLIELTAVALFFAGGDRDNLERVSRRCNQFGIQRVNFFQCRCEGCFPIVECGFDGKQFLREVAGFSERILELGSQSGFFIFQ